MNFTDFATTLDSAALNAKATSQLSLKHTLSIKDAYHIQNLSVDRRLSQRGETLVGLKLGFTSKAKMEQMGVHDMIWGKLTDKMAYTHGADLKLDAFIHPRAEPEIAFLIGKDIHDEITLENAATYVESVAIALEIIDSRYENFKFSLEDVIADNCSSAAFTVGPWMPADTNISDIRISMVSDDIIVAKGNSNAILGNPWASLVAAARLTKEAGGIIKKGEILLAGAATSAVYIKAGETISAHGEGLGSVYLDIV